MTPEQQAELLLKQLTKPQIRVMREFIGHEHCNTSLPVTTCAPLLRRLEKLGLIRSHELVPARGSKPAIYMYSLAEDGYGVVRRLAELAEVPND